MVPEQPRQDLQLHGLPHGARATREDLHYTVCHMVPSNRVKTCNYRSATWFPSST